MNGARREQIGPWKLGRRLGQGGNGIVWEATRDDTEGAVALKVINTRKVEREPYQRFVREIQFLRDHADLAGILPILDSNLPTNPTRSDEPWLAMPIATPISRSLAGRTLPEVVAAVAAITATLAGLEADFDVAHRDVKPGNLYELNGSWLIGDFGLVTIADSATLTAEGRPLGPAHFTAYEMLGSPESANAHLADVYSLGKTLWVLATDQRFPPEGNQPVGTRGFGIGDFRPHPRADALDQEVDRMTRLHPEERPTKEQVARDLRTWLELSTDSPSFDLSDLRLRLRSKLEAQLSEREIEEQRKDLAYAAIRRLQELTQPLNTELKALHPDTKVDLQTDKMTQNLLQARVAFPKEIVFRWQRCTLVAPLDYPGAPTLRMMRSLELVNDGDLLLNLWVFVGPEGVMGMDFNWQPPLASAPVGSIEAERMLEEGVGQLAEALVEGLRVLVEKLPGGDAEDQGAG